MESSGEALPGARSVASTAVSVLLEAGEGGSGGPGRGREASAVWGVII